MLRVFTVAIAGLLISASVAAAGTLDRIRESGTIKIGYIADAPPYSYKSAVGEPAGYTVDLCRAVVARIKSASSIANLSVEYVEVTGKDRFEAIQTGRIDLLCGATTATLSRREKVDFSVAIFVDGAGVLLRKDGPASFAELAGKKVGVLAGTTTQEALNNTVEKLDMQIETIAVEDHTQGIEMLIAGEVAAYFSDRGILLYLAAASGAPEQLRLSDQQFTYEPYALALQRGDEEFRLAVDRALSRIYRSGEISKIFAGAFGPNISPTAELLTLYRISALPE